MQTIWRPWRERDPVEGWWLPAADAYGRRAVGGVRAAASTLRHWTRDDPVFGRVTVHVPDPGPGGGGHTGHDVPLVLRLPRLSDGPGWRATRLAEHERLQAQFADRIGPGGGAGDGGWDDGHGALAWTERCLRARRAAARGLALPGVLVPGQVAVNGGPAVDGGAVLGEVGIEHIDRRTATGELAFWRSTALHGSGVGAWAVATVVDRAFTGPRPLDRVVAPVAVGNAAAARCVERVGFTAETRLPDFRPYDGEARDHDIYVVHNSASTRRAVREMITS